MVLVGFIAHKNRIDGVIERGRKDRGRKIERDRKEKFIKRMIETELYIHIYIYIYIYI